MHSNLKAIAVQEYVLDGAVEEDEPDDLLAQDLSLEDITSDGDLS